MKTSTVKTIQAEITEMHARMDDVEIRMDAAKRVGVSTGIYQAKLDSLYVELHALNEKLDAAELAEKAKTICKPSVKKIEYLPSLRVRLNWGYHDGAHSITWKDAQVICYAQNMAISRLGFCAGRRDALQGTYSGDSQRAYIRWLLRNGINFGNPKRFYTVNLLMGLGS